MCKIFGVGGMERWRIAGSDGRETQVPLLVSYTRPMYWIFLSDITSSAAAPDLSCVEYKGGQAEGGSRGG